MWLDLFPCPAVNASWARRSNCWDQVNKRRRTPYQRCKLRYYCQLNQLNLSCIYISVVSFYNIKLIIMIIWFGYALIWLAYISNIHPIQEDIKSTFLHSRQPSVRPECDANCLQGRCRNVPITKRVIQRANQACTEQLTQSLSQLSLYIVVRKKYKI